MDPVNLIGFVGHARNGKSTCAMKLVGMGWHLEPLAGPIKEMLINLGVPPSHVWGGDKEVPMPLLCGMTARHAMQTLGTEWGRDLIGENIWLNAWKLKVNKHLSQRRMVVVDDVRFPNESKAIKDMGGFIIRVLRNEPDSSDDHSSEVLIDSIKYDHILTNFGSVEELRDKIAIFGKGQ